MTRRVRARAGFCLAGGPARANTSQEVYVTNSPVITDEPESPFGDHIRRHHGRIPNALFAELRGNLLAIVLYGWLSGRYGGFKDGIYPAVPTLAAELGRSDRQIQRAISDLAQAGWLTVRRRPDNTNIYELTLDDKKAARIRAGMKKRSSEVVTSVTPPGDINDTGVVTSMSPNTARGNQLEGTSYNLLAEATSALRTSGARADASISSDQAEHDECARQDEPVIIRTDYEPRRDKTAVIDGARPAPGLRCERGSCRNGDAVRCSVGNGWQILDLCPACRAHLAESGAGVAVIADVNVQQCEKCPSPELAPSVRLRKPDGQESRAVRLCPACQASAVSGGLVVLPELAEAAQ
jgi:hypothetical protein